MNERLAMMNEGDGLPGDQGAFRALADTRSDERKDDDRKDGGRKDDVRKDDGRKDDGRRGVENPSTGVAVKARPKTRKPAMYKVLMLNDDYTPMEFVVHVLERFFNKDHEAATQIMLHVHHHGIGECGVYTYEVAETKVTQVMDFARKHQHPLQCVMEKK